MIKLNGNPINITIFPDNTSQVWKLNEKDFDENTYVDWEFSHEGEIMHLAQLKYLLDNYSCGRVHLHIKYLPYARQDKPVSNITTFALTPFLDIVNSLKFYSITVLDTHNYKSLKKIENASNVFPSDAILNTFRNLGSTVLENSILRCFPDSGAYLRYKELGGLNCIIGRKQRDQLTGQILDIQLDGDCHLKKVLIIDDICDGGGTFTKVATELYKRGATDVYLYTTHGIYSKGLKPLQQAGIKRIFNYDGEVSEYKNNITIKHWS